MPMLAGVGLLCCVSSSVAAAVYNKGDEEDPVVPKTPVKAKADADAAATEKVNIVPITHTQALELGNYSTLSSRYKPLYYDPSDQKIHYAESHGDGTAVFSGTLPNPPSGTYEAGYKIWVGYIETVPHPGPTRYPFIGYKDKTPYVEPSTESKDIPEETPSDPYADWRFVKGIDYKGKLLFTHTMHDVPPASKEVCLNKCKESNRCKFVTFTQTENMCWGYETGGEAVHHGNRNNYFKP